MSNNHTPGTRNLWGQNPSAAPTPAYSYDNLPPRPAGNGLAITGFIFSILGLGFLLPLFGLIAIPFTLLGLILSIIGFLRARNGLPRGGLALAGIIIAGAGLIGGAILNAVFYHSATRDWTAVDTTLPAPTGAQAEALIGEWAFEGTHWFRFDANGIGENLSDGERFNWLGDGTFQNAASYYNWQVAGDTLTVTWITGNSFEYTRITS